MSNRRLHALAVTASTMPDETEAAYRMRMLHMIKQSNSMIAEHEYGTTMYISRYRCRYEVPVSVRSTGMLVPCDLKGLEGYSEYVQLFHFVWGCTLGILPQG